MFFKSASYTNFGSGGPESGHPVVASVALGSNAMIKNMLSVLDPIMLEPGQVLLCRLHLYKNQEIKFGQHPRTSKLWIGQVENLVEVGLKGCGQHKGSVLGCFPWAPQKNVGSSHTTWHMNPKWVALAYQVRCRRHLH